MDIISRKYINEGFNSKAYIINDDYILLDGVNQNSYKNYQKYVNVINQISNVKSLEIPRIIELIEPCEEYPNGALIYKMIKGHTFRKEHIEIVNLDNIAKKLAEFMDELYEIRVDFDKDEYIKNELEITEQSVIELKEYLSESNYEKILSWFNEYKNYLLTFNDYHFIHGDLWYENYILNDNNELVGIVDFEGSGSTSKMTTSFLFHYYTLFGDELALKYCQGTKQQSYTAAIVKILPITYPVDIDEQNAITAVLNDMNSEISALEEKLTKALFIKSGMMSELLTGTIRLLDKEDV